MKKDKIVELEHIAELEHSTLYNEIFFGFFWDLLRRRQLQGYVAS